MVFVVCVFRREMGNAFICDLGHFLLRDMELYSPTEISR